MLINKAEETRLLYSLNTGRPSGAYALMNAHANQMGQPSHGHPTQSLCIAIQLDKTLLEVTNPDMEREQARMHIINFSAPNVFFMKFFWECNCN